MKRRKPRTATTQPAAAAPLPNGLPEQTRPALAQPGAKAATPRDRISRELEIAAILADLV